MSPDTGSDQIINVVSPIASTEYGHSHVYVRALVSAGGTAYRAFSYDGGFAAGPSEDAVTSVWVPTPLQYGLRHSKFVRIVARVIGQFHLPRVAQASVPDGGHSHDFFEAPEFVTLAAGLLFKRRIRPFSVVLHNVNFAMTRNSWTTAVLRRLRTASVKRVIREASVVVVHGAGLRKRLIEQLDLPDMLAEKVVGIQYGSHAPVVRGSDGTQARSQLGLRTGPERWALLFGTVRKDKQYEVVGSALSSRPKWGVLLAGPDGDLSSREAYELLLRGGASPGQVSLLPGFVPDDQVPLLFTAVDVVVALYADADGHQSGPVSLARTYLRPVIAGGGSEIESYVRERGVGWVANSSAEIGEALDAIAALNAEDSEAMNTRIGSAAEDLSWGRSFAPIFMKLANGLGS